MAAVDILAECALLAEPFRANLDCQVKREACYGLSVIVVIYLFISLTLEYVATIMSPEPRWTFKKNPEQQGGDISIFG